MEQKRFFRNEIRHNCKAMRSGEIQLVNTESRPLESNRQDARGTRLLMMEDTKLYAVTLKELVQSN
ncbi:hypothetical protein GCM10010969_26940 [Saccharibacillus kuerlensis]|uniref:Uncharacterized protein n=1 Tax=Saccharibacillus kuerlensis TaxID=459527 RepID=A0ABQ2L643_9BACL|nr:hypothetical protein GCM10010969_26940 [Saccharibacillus kuerlensis]